VAVFPEVIRHGGRDVAFERWYGVGDFVQIEPAQVGGMVEQFGLRSTLIRSLNGDRTYIPNSQIISATRSPRGYRTYSIELLTSDPDDARRAIEGVGRRSPVGEARFLPPRVIDERELGEGAWLVRGRADVAPTMEWLAEGLLVAALKAQLRSESLLAEPIIYTSTRGRSRDTSAACSCARSLRRAAARTPSAPQSPSGRATRRRRD
jgi:mechanosensitive ion channel-like protein